MVFNFHATAQGFMTEFRYSEQKITTKNDPIRDKVPNKVPDKVPNSISDNMTKILIEIRNDKHVSLNELAHTIGISKRKILDNINKLKKMGMIKRIGNNKSGYWQIAPIYTDN